MGRRAEEKFPSASLIYGPNEHSVRFCGPTAASPATIPFAAANLRSRSGAGRAAVRVGSPSDAPWPILGPRRRPGRQAIGPLQRLRRLVRQPVLRRAHRSARQVGSPTRTRRGGDPRTPLQDGRPAASSSRQCRRGLRRGDATIGPRNTNTTLNNLTIASEN